MPSQTSHDSTSSESWQINADQDGPRIKDLGGGVMGVRTAADDNYAPLAIGEPTASGHAITKGWGESDLSLSKSIDAQLAIETGKTRLSHRPRIADGVTVDIANTATWKVI